MARQKIKNPMAVLSLITTMISFSAIIVLFIIGGVFYGEERPKVLNYASSQCVVDSRSYKVYECTSRYFTYVCYGPTWSVRHGEQRDVFATVETKGRYSSYRDALNKADQYQIGSTYECWYDTRNPSIAQWEKPSTTTAVILLCFGGFSVLLLVLFTYLSIKLIKQEIAQARYDNTTASPYSSAYMKQ